MDRSRYFDNAATTPIDTRVRESMLPFLDEVFGNASSIHAFGLRARAAVEHAREQIARLIGAEDPSQIYFTSGATEASNWVLNAAEQVTISPFEHSAMREPALRMGGRVLSNTGVEIRGDLPGADSEIGGPTAGRHGPTSGADSEIRGPTLLSVMAVNNEIGTMWDVRDYGRAGDLLHSDVTQALGKVPTTVDGMDFASFSAHKFYGPKGVGALYCKDRPPESLILGGEQEQGFRGGTLNVPGIVGMGAAAAIALQEQEKDQADAAEMKAILLDGLNGLADTRMNGGDRTSPFIVSVSFQGLEGETLVLEMDRAGYAISAGAACSSRSTEPSHVLTALRLEPEWLRGTVRISFGRFNGKEKTAEFAKKLRSVVDLLRTL